MKHHTIKAFLKPTGIPKNYRRQKLEKLWGKRIKVKRYPYELIYTIPTIKY